MHPKNTRLDPIEAIIQIERERKRNESKHMSSGASLHMYKYFHVYICVPWLNVVIFTNEQLTNITFNASYHFACLHTACNCDWSLSYCRVVVHLKPLARFAFSLSPSLSISHNVSILLFWMDYTSKYQKPIASWLHFKLRFTIWCLSICHRAYIHFIQ